LQAEIFQNASELHGKHVTFLDALIVKLRQELFHKACMEKTSKIRRNFTANSFVFGRINRDNAPRNLLLNMIADNFQNASEHHGKQLRFWTHIS